MKEVLPQAVVIYTERVRRAGSPSTLNIAVTRVPFASSTDMSIASQAIVGSYVQKAAHIMSVTVYGDGTVDDFIRFLTDRTDAEAIREAIAWIDHLWILHAVAPETNDEPVAV